MRFLPKSRDPGWAPYTWLLYLCFFFLNPILNHVGWKSWLATGLGTLVFLVLYFNFFWIESPRSLINVGAILLLGVGFAPFNEGSATFFVFAGAFIPFAVETESTAFALLTAVLGVAALEWWLLHLSGWFLFYGGGLSVVVGASNIYFAQRSRANERLRKANDEIGHLAKVAERERIARDLHDVLGHTLSVIILKSELAGKLIDRDPQRARAEIADVEQTSRAALADVRSTIRGYRAHSLEAELKQAKATLETAGVTAKTESQEVRLTPAQESVVALVVREAVTNVVRHAHARNCLLRLTPENGSCRIEIHDDGRGGGEIEGNGLRGMRERIEALGGTFERQSSAGTRLNIQFPLTQSFSAPRRLRWPVIPSPKSGRKAIRVVIAEDQGMVLGALAALLEIEGDISVVARSRNGKDALQAVLEHKPDVFITDIEMPEMTGLDVAGELKRRRTGTRVIILTTFARAGYLRRALEAGASGYLLKDMRAEELAEAVRRVQQGLRVIDPELATEAWAEPDPLTDRERQVLRLAGEGKSSGEIAGDLGLSEGTVRNYLSEAISKLGANNRIEAARIARTKGWL